MYANNKVCYTENTEWEYFPIDSTPFNDKGYATFDESN